MLNTIQFKSMKNIQKVNTNPVILNDCSRSRPCPCYYVFAAFM
ncbi:unnamed protein product [Tenebrio molitor]|nr:unnamed protein product [Tenebrio molitor]